MSISNQRGNVLLFVIAGIAMIASIAMGMFYMTSTSSLGQAGGSGMNRAYYLALAGKDYATANWSNMASWNNSESSLSNTESFHLSSSGGIITSTGIVNKNTPFEARKTITAQSPSPVKRHFLDTFENLTNWATGTQVGGFQAVIPPSDTNKALDVTSAQIDAFGSGSGKWSFLQLNAGTAGVDLSTPWKDAGYCLNHDLQVKIKNSQPYYMAGLNFKVAGSENSREFYGISYLRARKSRSWSLFSGWSAWDDSDNIPNDLKPLAIYNLSYGSLYYVEGFPIQYQYSHPAVVLWKRYLDTETGQYFFTWLSCKLLTDNDYVVYDNNPPGKNYLLSPWSNLQVRLNEAFPFSSGGPSPLLNGEIVVGATSGASARISGTPIMISETWSSNSASGALALTDVSRLFQSGESLLVNGVTRAIIEAKTNYIRVYYGDEGDHGADGTLIGNIRGSNTRNAAIHWPADNVSDWNTSNDYMTLVQWDGCQASAEILSGSGEANAIIKDSSLLTPNSGTIDYSGVALHATGNTANSTYFDDFAIQY